MGSNRREGVVPGTVLSDDEMFAGIDGLDSAAPSEPAVPEGCAKCEACGHIDRAENFMNGCPMCEGSTSWTADRIAAEAKEVPALDKKGFPWDARIHGEAKNINKDGTWRLIRGVDKELVKQVRAESAGKEGLGSEAPQRTLPELPPSTEPQPGGITPTATTMQPTAPPQITADVVIAKYVETRDLIAAKTKALKVELEEMKLLQEKREAWLQGELTKLGLDSFKTSAGTAFTKWADSATVADRAIFLDWVHEKWEDRESFLENRVSKSAVKQRLEDGEVLPPGINYSKIKGLNVRRA